MQALTVRIPVRDSRGSVVDEKEVATYAGLLSRAHEEGLKSIGTLLTQAPTKDNGHVAIAAATVITSKGTFMGIGDASPENVNRKIVPHIIRMAETRAKARALRDAVNIGVVCLEELGGAEGEHEPLQEPDGEPRDNVRPFRGRDEGDRPRDERPRNDDRRPEERPRESDRRPEDRRGEDRSRTDDRRGGERPRGDRSSGGGNGRPDKMTDNQRRFLLRLLGEDGIEGDRAVETICDTAKVSSLAELTKHQASKLIDGWNKERRGA